MSVEADVEANKALIRDWVEAANALDESAIDRVFALDFANHTASVFPGTDPGIEGLRKTWATSAEVNRVEGVHREVEFQVAEGDLVVTRLILSGRHTAPFLGLPATDRTWRMGAVVVNRVSGGRIVEQWGEVDALGKVRQLGGTVCPEDTAEGGAR